ncbi:hypothetical protein [Streptomyces sp. FIT100]|uniref:hypothetical protein n=1 Tax=Streptomyces sp. FIT100 TaxID=2837956 RepID=UPI0021C6C47A|nr:hypothetical protein [Streptomyces sp. FIT100]UUN31620.1 hypothetical protein KK483_18725 [Streptomyces sp. FIT100]
MAEKAGRQRSGHTKAAHPVQATLAHPMETVTAVVDRVPGVDRVKHAFDGVLDSVGVVSPHARRVTAYAGAGLLGVAGVIEWPVAVAGAAVVWLTQPRSKEDTSQGSRAAASGNGMRAKQAARSAKASTVPTTSTASRKPKSSAKSSSKSAVKSTVKSAVKSSSKAPAKSAVKSSSKVSAKPAVKSSSKVSAKPAVKSSSKVSAKPSAKSSSKSSAKKAPTTAGRSRSGPSAQRSSTRKTASAGRKKS